MFGKIIGNGPVKDILLRLRAAGRIPNAMLFAGLDGVGKRLFAIEVARSFVCRAQTEEDPACGECPSCIRAGEFTLPKPDARDDFKKVISSNHPDVATVVAQNRSIFVDAIRDLESEAHYRPYEGDARTFIIDDADKMNDAASNALLKTLEEPSATTHIFLITSRPDSLLPTIRSRCQTLRFGPVAAVEIKQYLIEKYAVPGHEAWLAAQLSGGSLGRALSIDVTQFREQRDRMLAVVLSAAETRDRVALLRIAEELNDAKNKDSFEDNLGILESLIHDIWSIGLERDASDMTNADIADDLAALAEDARIRDLPNWLTDIQMLRENLIVNVNRKVSTDALFMRMAA